DLAGFGRDDEAGRLAYLIHLSPRHLDEPLEERALLPTLSANVTAVAVEANAALGGDDLCRLAHGENELLSEVEPASFGRVALLLALREKGPRVGHVL